ncbi:MAG: cell division protein FtsZ [Burkholderiales bacterium]|nr:cell division protein FtsZ [Burkholderiales bacterium]
MGNTFEVLETETNGTVIKVIGVGGAGGNAIAHMIRREVGGVEFIAANTDAQVLTRTGAGTQIQLGGTGLGAGGRPERGREFALTERERIVEALEGAHMVFITAGMGGGTGTGAAPVVAEIAKEMGILTVGVVTKPFLFEGGRRMRSAEAGIQELAQHVDSLIVILNEKLMEVLGEDVEMGDAFAAADDVLHNAVAGISEIINQPGLINVDFEDVKTVMAEMGMAMMGSAWAEGMDRARIAAEQAVASPLLEGVDLTGARGVLVNITASKSLKMKEYREVMETIKAFADPDAHVICGAVFDDSIGDKLRVTVVATGLGRAMAKRGDKPQLVPQTVLRTGTDNAPIAVATPFDQAPAVDYGALETPAVFRSGRADRRAQVEALANAGMDKYEIPAFLRKQAD